MLERDDAFKVNYICTYTSGYTLETLEAYKNFAVKPKESDKKIQKVSNVDIKQFKQMVWTEANPGCINEPLESFIFFERSNKNKAPRLAAVTKCCHSLCFFNRGIRKTDNTGPEDHWCP